MSEANAQQQVRFWAVIPAAGSGRRMGADIPKQYLSLAGHSVLEHTLHRLSLLPAISGIMVVLSPDDTYWKQQRLDWVARPVYTVQGGQERSDSVINGLHALAPRVSEADWVLVHDAARPCVRPQDIQTLISSCRDDPVGGLLARPVNDTMKQGDADARVVTTVPRSNLWHALTPQMFRYGTLLQALEQARAQGLEITDEAMAMEAAGLPGRLVEGHADNIKITRPEDLALAEYYLRVQGDPGLYDRDDGMEDGG